MFVDNLYMQTPSVKYVENRPFTHSRFDYKIIITNGNKKMFYIE
jgi:hypothetical protein